MKSSTLVLLLLCCCSSEGGTVSATTVLTQQDVHSVLSALAEMREEMKSVETRLRVSESQVEELKRKLEEQSRRNEGRKVAFSAYFNRPEANRVGPFNIATKLVFDKIITNIGNAYNRITGAFTAPVRGVYQFDLHIQGEGSSSTPTAVDLLKNGNFIIVAHGHQPDYRVSTSNGVSLLLEAGDIITLHLPPGRNIYGDVYRLSTFSGHLLFPM